MQDPLPLRSPATVHDFAAWPADGALRVCLPQFEGPLDLLLHLIQKHELDVFDIPIAFVTERYLEYVTVMQSLDLDLAAEYLLMAATLTHIKSRMLLPSPPPDEPESGLDQDTHGEDPRAELVRRLLEYQKFKSAAAELATRGVAGRDVFSRGAAIELDSPEITPLAELPVYDLLDAFRKLLERRKLELSHEVTAERVSISERIQELVERLREVRAMTFDALFDDTASTVDVVVTFLALLEMTRLRMTRLYQSALLEPLHVTLVLTDLGAAEVRDDWR